MSQMSVFQLVGEYGGKLQECERQIDMALSFMAGQPTRPAEAVHAGKAGSTIYDMRRDYNAIIASNGPDVDKLLSGEIDGKDLMVTLQDSEYLALESIDMLYDRLRAVL